MPLRPAPSGGVSIPSQGSSGPSSQSVGTSAIAVAIDLIGSANQSAESSQNTAAQSPAVQNFADESDNSLASVLAKIGINALRAEVIAAIEFSPLTKEKTAQFTVTPSESEDEPDDVVIEDTTGAARLIEKQLILQQTVAKNIEIFFETINDFDLSDFIITVRASIRNLNLESEIKKKGTISEMKDFLKQAFRNAQVNISANPAIDSNNQKESRSKADVGSTKRAVVEQNQIVSAAKKLADAIDNEYADLALEYVVTDFYIRESLTFIAEFVAAKQALINSFSISKMRNFDSADIYNNPLNIRIASKINRDLVSNDTISNSFLDAKSFQEYYYENVAGPPPSPNNPLLGEMGTSKLILTMTKALAADVLMAKNNNAGKFDPANRDPARVQKVAGEADFILERDFQRLDAVKLYFISQAFDDEKYGIKKDEDNETPFEIRIGTPYRADLIPKLFAYSISDLMYASNVSFKGTIDEIRRYFESFDQIEGASSGNPNIDASLGTLLNPVNNLREFVNEVFFKGDLTRSQNIANSALNSESRNDNSLGPRLVKSIDFGNLKVLPFENDYDDMKSPIPIPEYELGQYYFVDNAIQRDQLSLTELRRFLKKYKDNINAASNDYLRIHGKLNPADINISGTNAFNDFDSYFLEFRKNLSSVVKDRFLDNTPTKERTYAYTIFMFAAQNKKFALLLFRNAIFRHLLKGVYNVADATDKQIFDLQYKGEPSLALTIAVEQVTEVELKQTLFKMQSPRKLRNQLFKMFANKFFNVSLSDLESGNDVMFYDKHVPEKKDDRSKLGVFPKQIDDYNHEYNSNSQNKRFANKESVETLRNVAHGVGGGEKRDFENALDLCIQWINKVCMSFDLKKIVPKSSNLNGVFQASQNLYIPAGGNVGSIPNDKLKRVYQQVIGCKADTPSAGATEMVLVKSSKNLNSSEIQISFNQVQNVLIPEVKVAAEASSYFVNDYGRLDSTLDTTYLSRAMSYYLLMLRLLYNGTSIRTVIKKNNPNNNTSRRIMTFNYSKLQFRGFCDALDNLDMRGQQSNLNYNVNHFYRNGYTETTGIIREVLDAYREYFYSGARHLTVLSAHQNRISYYRKRLVNILNVSNDDSQLRKEITKFYKQNVPGTSASYFSLLSDEQIKNNFAAYIRTYQQNKNFNLLPASSINSHEQCKNLFKVLTRKGFGFQSSENLGRKTAFHIGLPTGLINTIRKKTAKSTRDDSFLDSNIVAIFINRQNLSNPREVVYPKCFVFDVSKYILEDPNNGTEALDALNIFDVVNDQLTDYSDGKTYSQLKDDHGIVSLKTFNAQGEGSAYETAPPLFQLSDRYFVNLKGKAFENSAGDEIYSSTVKDAIYENHLTDYYLKMYFRLMLGVDLHEHSFQIDATKDFTGVAGGAGVDGNKNSLFQGDFRDKTLLLFPDANVDQSVAREFDRFHSSAGNSLIFKSNMFMNGVLAPKIFDRVFSVLINERDFIIHPNSLKNSPQDVINNSYALPLGVQLQNASAASQVEDFNQIYTGQIPKFSLKGELQVEGSNVKNSLLANYPTLREYSKSLNPNSPQMYSYSVEIALLPKAKN